MSLIRHPISVGLVFFTMDGVPKFGHINKVRDSLLVRTEYPKFGSIRTVVDRRG
jgi:hypothetical protein